MLKNYPGLFVYIKPNKQFFLNMLFFFKKGRIFTERTIFVNLKMLNYLLSFTCLKDSSFGSEDMHIQGDIKHESVTLTLRRWKEGGSHI